MINAIKTEIQIRIGVLQMTRSFGDFQKNLNVHPNSQKYIKDGIITCQPDIIKVDLTKKEDSEYYLLLASDGLWDIVDTFYSI